MIPLGLPATPEERECEPSRRFELFNLGPVTSYIQHVNLDLFDGRPEVRFGALNKLVGMFDESVVNSRFQTA